MYINERFWNSSVEQIKSGYIQDNKHYVCLLCGHKIERGIIYSENGILYEAEKFMEVHIEQAHQSVFAFLINLDKKFTGLSEHQNRLLRLFYLGLSDEEVQKELGIGSRSTIRNHRFVLREKERQSRIFLTLMELLKEKDRTLTEAFSRPAGRREGDDGQERDRILKKYFPDGLDRPLKTLKMKEKSRIMVMEVIAARFEAGRTYGEKEVNAILGSIHDDGNALRRYLIDYGFMERTADGSRYWLTKGSEELEKKTDRKKELKQRYLEIKIEGGVYQIRNTINNKVLVMATPNFKTMNGRRMELRSGGFRNRRLQEEWKQYGEDAFVFEVLEVLPETEDPFFDKRGELSRLEEKWLERLQPYEERGYHLRGER